MNEGNVSWIENNQVDGKLWPAPGRWLRKSMIHILARAQSYDFLSTEFIESEIEGTFQRADIAKRPLEEEQDAATMMSMGLESAMAYAGTDLDDDEYDSDGWYISDDDEDGEDKEGDENRERQE